MKNYKKGLLTLMVLSAMSLMAAEDKTIYVNTFDDIDDQSSSKCSLRMAMKAAELNRSYGGCSAGNTAASAMDYIQLEEGVYKLNSELVPASSISIVGKIPQDYSKVDVITNDYPAKTVLKSIIDGESKTRLINTSNSKVSISISNVQFQNGKNADRGGALYLGAATTLTGVSVLNSTASQGGAIYLEGNNAALTMTSGIYQNNKAVTGSVLAMSCKDNLDYNKRTFTLTNNSFIQNGSNESKSTLEFCGEPTATLTANTIAQNTANAANGSIIKFTSDRLNIEDDGKLSTSSSLVLNSNTIVENTAFSTFLYDKIGTKILTFNVLAFNSNRSCRYLLGEAKDEKDTGVGLAYNALNLVAGGNSQCDVASEVLPEEQTNINVGNNNISTVLSPLQTASEYTSFLPVYFPKDNHTATDLVDVGADGCSTQDQRGINRITDGTLILNPAGRNSCDIGSTEIMRLTAGDINGIVNTSLVDLIANYQTQLDFFKDLVANSSTNPDFLPYYNKRVKEYEDLINYTKANEKYRAVYVDPFAFSLPDETELADGSRQIQHLTTDTYAVSVTPVGVGMITGSGDTAKLESKPDENLKCEWNADLKRIMVYRLDDGITQAGEYNFCEYTLTMKNADGSLNTNRTSSGLMQVNFVNIAPIATADEYTIQYGTDQKINVNLLANDSDDGDGPVSAMTTKPNKPAFYHNSEGIELPIRVTTVPSGVSITPERSGPCPYPDEKETCYGGNLTIQVKNNFNVFDYKFSYLIYDADETKSSETTVTLKNTASTTNNQSGSGGGSLGIFTVLGLIGLVLYRRRS
ncbi:CSLREA domain-containing protein [Acinetobacter sp. S40]|uniref:CSLREA domain-containing protein n=1 Tax=Acinetobacter sp. S40 TaxID=2767434 RepID=UPI00190BF39F|nr:CSLREA domain-containing protein [Acinetobacter sp. S40]MBJ9986364.1 CSLREA domain-containing protein [Acinetobacter sp. S40]